MTEEKIDEYELRQAPFEEVEKELLKLYGIGPASLNSLLSILRKHPLGIPPIITIPPWEQKIYSRLLFDKELVPADKIVKFVKNYSSKRAKKGKLAYRTPDRFIYKMVLKSARAKSQSSRGKGAL